MATSTKRSPASAVSKSAIEQATFILHDLPEKPREVRSLRETVHLMRDTILGAIEKGYTYDEIAQILSDKGVGIRPSSLRYYLNASKREKAGSAQSRVRVPRKPRTKKSTEEAVSPPAAFMSSEALTEQPRVSEGTTGEEEASQGNPQSKTATATKSKVPTRSKTTAKTKSRSASKANPAAPQSTSSRQGRSKKGSASQG